MKTKITELKIVNHKGHVIRKVEDEFGNVFVLIDNNANEVENAPAFMTEKDFAYASIADAKRTINGDTMKYVFTDIFDYWKTKYLTRFK